MGTGEKFRGRFQQIDSSQKIYDWLRSPSRDQDDDSDSDENEEELDFLDFLGCLEFHFLVFWVYLDCLDYQASLCLLDFLDCLDFLGFRDHLCLQVLLGPLAQGKVASVPISLFKEEDEQTPEEDAANSAAAPAELSESGPAIEDSDTKKEGQENKPSEDGPDKDFYHVAPPEKLKVKPKFDTATGKPEATQQQVSSSKNISRPIIIKVQANKDIRTEQIPDALRAPTCESTQVVEQPLPEVWDEVEIQNEVCVEDNARFQQSSGDDMFVAVMDTEDICLAAVEEVACSSSDDLSCVSAPSPCLPDLGMPAPHEPVEVEVVAEVVAEEERAPPPPPPPPKFLRLKPRRSKTVEQALPSPVSSSSGCGEEDEAGDGDSPPPPPPPPGRPPAPVKCLVLPPPPATGILIPAGRGSLSGEPKKSRRHRTRVKVIMPSSIVDRLPPPPPPPKKAPAATVVAATPSAAPAPVAVEAVGAAYAQYGVHLPQQAGYPAAAYAVPYNSYPAGYAVPYAAHLAQQQAYTYVAATQASHHPQLQPQLYANAATVANAATAVYYHQQQQMMQTVPVQAQQPPQPPLPPRPPT
ncbi:hypothetical protein IscW_ISCW017576 [Ixodes scapularis]|uniref:Uncharacterized protein n=1 Tax=Ixodes scapularis TaxID=6945 RepID=B7PG94_IXOSC|nr:hypothetical protein IscW_ISCW017576 [Ixodes scapularis]|eukprot:XP_002434216.1 hypothetical protein IscW_ISCW017576 [Ixodes scapularis]